MPHDLHNFMYNVSIVIWIIYFLHSL